MSIIPVRSTDPALTGVTALECSVEAGSNGLPHVGALLVRAAEQPLDVTLRIHNQAGIPIIEAQSRLEPGAQRLHFSELLPLGIEAYAHAPAERRLEVAQRVWSRRAYATLRCTPRHVDGAPRN